jgi:hypothetical protein
MRRQSGVEPYEAFIKQVIEVVESVSSSRALRPVASRVALTALASEITEEMRQALENDGD